MTVSFDYATLTTRNLGFITVAEQHCLRRSSVFVCGAGGMGGVVIEILARAGVGAMEIADHDHFELSNLNRQLLATLETLGRPKTEVARERLRTIRPDLELRTHGREWEGELPDILGRCHVVVNAMDDLRAGLVLYRAAAQAGATVIDAYTSPLPSVVCVKPEDPRPEQRLGWPTIGLPIQALTPALAARCRELEIEYVLTHSSSLAAVDGTLAAEVIAGTRPRFSFAPMVTATGALMADEAVRALLDRRSGAGCAGYFLDLARGRIERPGPPWITAPRRWFVRRAMRRMSHATG